MDVFGRYPRPATVEGCPCCVSARDSEALLAGEPAALRRYAGKAISTWGGVDEFRHFLPRLLDAVAAGEVDLDTVTGKLGYAGWARWPADERAAVRARLVDLWRRDYRIDLLDALASAGLDPVKLLDMLPESLAAQRIAELLWQVSGSRRRDELVVAWLRRRATARVLADAFLAERSDTRVAELAWAIDELDLMS